MATGYLLAARSGYPGSPKWCLLPTPKRIVRRQLRMSGRDVWPLHTGQPATMISELFRRHHHYFNFPVRSSKRAAQTGAHGRVVRINPGIPDVVHRREIAHVSDPELRP